MDEGEEIVVPLVQNIGEVVVISGQPSVLLRSDSEEEHDGDRLRFLAAVVFGPWVKYLSV